MTQSQFNYSQDRTIDNVKFVRDQIKRKVNYNHPAYATCQSVTNSVTDFDHFPYTRYFRGVYYEDKPIVIEREAGFRPLHNGAYTPCIKNPPQPKPTNCWESACSVVYPCYPQYLRKYADKEELEIMLNRKCIIESP